MQKCMVTFCKVLLFVCPYECVQISLHKFGGLRDLFCLLFMLFLGWETSHVYKLTCQRWYISSWSLDTKIAFRIDSCISDLYTWPDIYFFKFPLNFILYASYEILNFGCVKVFVPKHTMTAYPNTIFICTCDTYLNHHVSLSVIMIVDDYRAVGSQFHPSSSTVTCTLCGPLCLPDLAWMPGPKQSFFLPTLQDIGQNNKTMGFESPDYFFQIWQHLFTILYFKPSALTSLTHIG